MYFPYDERTVWYLKAISVHVIFKIFSLYWLQGFLEVPVSCTFHLFRRIRTVWYLEAKRTRSAWPSSGFSRHMTIVAAPCKAQLAFVCCPCLFDCLFVSFVFLFACLFVCLLVCLFACLLVCLFAYQANPNFPKYCSLVLISPHFYPIAPIMCHNFAQKPSLLWKKLTNSTLSSWLPQKSADDKLL